MRSFSPGSFPGGTMIRTAYRFRFEPGISMDDVEQALALSVIAVESIFGEQAMMIDGRFSVDRQDRICLVDTQTQLGYVLAKVFAGYMNTALKDCFQTERIEYVGQLGDMLDLFGAFL